MSNLSVNTITDASGGSTASINGLTPQASNMQPHNLIINGAMTVAQRGTSSTSSGYSTVDRWKNNMPARYTFSQSTDAPDGYSYSMKAECTSTGSLDTTIFEQRFEGQNLVQTGFGTSSAKSLTLSFWIKSYQTGTFTAELYNPTATDRQISKSYTVNNSGVWEYKTITYPPDTSQGFSSDALLGMYLFMWFSADSTFTSGSLNSNAWATASNPNRVNSDIPNLSSSTSNYVQITGVQLEAGSTGSSFAHEDYGTTLSKCQRYYNRYNAGSSYAGFGNAFGTSTTTFRSTITWPSMRAVPTITQSNTGINVGPQYTVTSNNTFQIGANSAWVDFTINAAGITVNQSGIWNASNNAAAYVDFSAEL